jgi:aerobic carbon-monoxide dehydrogenase medium subunit
LKPARFDYLRPGSLQEAARILALHGADAKILAGGQTLMPMMNFRLVSPAVIVDVNDIPGLDGVVADAQYLRLGCLVRWHEIETSPVIAAENPLLAAAVRHIAHYPIRNRGTWAGSCAHADPAAEFPAVALLCGAEFVLQSARGTRCVAAGDFFLGPLTTALEADEMLSEVRFPAWPAGRRWGFEEFAIRAGDFAIAGIAALVDPPAAEPRCRLVCFGVGGRPVELRAAEAVIASDGLGPAAIARAAAAAAEEVDAQGDIHASAEYRRALVAVLTERSLGQAAGEAGAP